MATIRKRSGKWHVQVRKMGKSITKSFTSKSDAERWARDEEIRIENGQFTPRQKSVSLSFLLDKWRDEVLINLKSHSVDKYKVGLIKRKLGTLLLNEVTSEKLAEYRDSRLEKEKVSAQTVKHELGIIRRAMLHGIEWGFGSAVPYVKSPSLKGQGRKRRLNEEESARLRATVDEYMRNVIILLEETAMRRGELAKITLSDIDVKARLIYLGDTKNGDDRVAPVSKRGMEALSYLINNAKSEKLLNYSKDWLSRRFTFYRKSADIKDFRLHDLRHEGASLLFEKGLNVMEVGAITGHKDLASLNRYTHINTKHLLKKLDEK